MSHFHFGVFCRPSASLARRGPVFRRDTQSSVYPYSTSHPGDPAVDIAERFLARFKATGPQRRSQVLDANQLQLLSLTLNKDNLYPGSPSLALPPTQPTGRSISAPPDGTPIPPGYHLVYFTPQFLEEHLGRDGTDVSFNPDPPFTRRMWAGGEMLWPRSERDGRPNLLLVGQMVTETTRLLSAEPKTIRKTGEEMVVVGVEKTFENEDGVALIDKRNWVFRKELGASLSMKQESDLKQQYQNSHSKVSALSTPFCPSDGSYTRTLKQSPVALFRFSALTFNSHKIHYSVPWAREVEGHKNIVVHGPLNLISMLDFWRETRKGETRTPEYIVPERIKYRATNPIYADEEYRIVLSDEPAGTAVKIYNCEGKLSMNAEIVA